MRQSGSVVPKKFITNSLIAFVHLQIDEKIGSLLLNNGVSILETELGN